MSDGIHGSKGFGHADGLIGVATGGVAVLMTFRLLQALGAGPMGTLAALVLVVILVVAAVFGGDVMALVGCGLCIVAGVTWVGFLLGLRGLWAAIPPAGLILLMLLAHVVSVLREWRSPSVRRGSPGESRTLADRGLEIQDQAVRKAAARNLKKLRESSAGQPGREEEQDDD